VNNYGLLGGDRLSMAQGALQQTGNPRIDGQVYAQAQGAVLKIHE
jgi:flagellar basal body P-ring protein FlgI